MRQSIQSCAFRSAIISAILLALDTCPRSPASMAAAVWRLGTRTSNGSAFSAAMRVSRRRTASETVRPIAASVLAAFAFTFSSTRMWTMLVAIEPLSPIEYTLYIRGKATCGRAALRKALDNAERAPADGAGRAENGDAFHCAFGKLVRNHHPAKVLAQNCEIEETAHRSGEQKGVNPVQHAAVSRQQRT